MLMRGFWVIFALLLSIVGPLVAIGDAAPSVISGEAGPDDAIKHYTIKFSEAMVPEPSEVRITRRRSFPRPANTGWHWSKRLAIRLIRCAIPFGNAHPIS